MVNRVPCGVQTRLSVADLDGVVDVAAIALMRPGHRGAIYADTASESSSVSDSVKISWPR